MAKAVRLANGRQWSSQKGAVDHFREIRNRYADEVTIDDAQDHADLVALLERYDAAHAGQAPKIGIGVASFESALIRVQVGRHVVSGCVASTVLRPISAFYGRSVVFQSHKGRSSPMLAGPQLIGN
jgi:hypothetical protein